MKRILTSVLCVLTLGSMTGCFTAAGSVVGQQIQVSKQSRGEESNAHIEGTAIGAALDLAAVIAVVALANSSFDFGPTPPYSTHPDGQ
jgi:hypothetical protein